VQIREAAVADAAAIARVRVRSWQAAYRGLLPDSVLDGLTVEDSARIWAERLAGSGPRARVLVVQDEQVIGYAAFGYRRDDTPDEGELWAIYVDPSAWGGGAGHLLHAAALDALRSMGFRTAALWVLQGNERAIRFYTRAGWRLDGTTRVHLGAAGDEQPHLLMRRSLEPDTA
jgi:RimJ/RimL family protein N-acetyltransferase